MIYSKTQYSDMLHAVTNAIRENRTITFALALELGLDYDALTSLFNQQFVRSMRVDLKKINLRKVQSIVDRVKEGESLPTIALDFRVGTYKIARLYLEATIGKTFQMANLISNPKMIEDEKVRRDVLRMIETDPICSHDIDLTKECLGREYEDLLVNLLTSRHMCFETEADLRSRGKPKTPDILFLIPMGLEANGYDGAMMIEQDPYPYHYPHTDPLTIDPYPLYPHSTLYPPSPFSPGGGVLGGGTDADQSYTYGIPHPGFVINWVDSKAMFADDTTFLEQIDQFRAYNNRYGRGLVIYWHGVASSVYDLLQDDMVVVRDCFPSTWIFPTGEPADGRQPAFDKIGLP